MMSCDKCGIDRMKLKDGSLLRFCAGCARDFTVKAEVEEESGAGSRLLISSHQKILGCIRAACGTQLSTIIGLGRTNKIT